MKLKNASLNELVDKVKRNNRKIILFGVGVIAQVVFQYISKRHELVKLILFAVDNDPSKIGTTLEIGGKVIPVRHSIELEKIGSEEYIILITSSHYEGIIQQLESMKNLINNECYILPVMFLSHLKIENTRIYKESKNPLIPKKIHYMWFGSKTLPKALQKCVESWEKLCPDYEIIRWDESNYDLNTNPYMKRAYELKQWGFIPDYARLDILFQHGGIYLDTDVELIRNLDELLYQSAFTSTEKWRVVNIGGCTGAVPKHPAIKSILDFRENVKFENLDGSLNRMASGYYDTLPFLNEGYQLNGINQCVNGMNIYTFDYFHPYDYVSGEMVLSKNTFSIHHFNGGWLDEKTKLLNKKARKEYSKLLTKMEENGDGKTKDNSQL